MPFPSTDQSSVIQHRGKPLIVVAGPGTGKTRTLVERMLVLLTEDATREVTFITFTRTSRRDTERKLLEILGKAVLDKPGLMFPRTSTLHGYAKQLVHRYAKLLSRNPAFSMLVESKGERDLILKEIATDLSLNVELETLSKAVKCQRATTEWPPSFSLGTSRRMAILERYELLLALYRTFDMEGVVLAATEILESARAALPRLFLQVDEYQDLTPIDQRFVDLSASHPASEVVVVGDDAQSIYGFRYAHYEGVQSLWDSQAWDSVRFADSFRLPAHILNAALDLISESNYVGAKMNRKAPNDERILTLQCTTSDIQVEAVARHISDMIDNTPGKEGSPITYSDVLVLCPTGDQARLAAKQLDSKHGIPAHIPPKTVIPSDYWTVILLLRILHHQDPLALRQWLPVLGFTSDEIRMLRDEAISGCVPFFDHCFSTADERIAHFQERLDQLRVSTDCPEEFSNLLGSVDGVQMPEDFVEVLNSVSRHDGSPPSLDGLIQIIYQRFGVLDEDKVIPDEDRVLVETMHRAKGLEAKFVYCLWLNAKYMPMPKRDRDEQRRIMYVALTRAKQDVILAFHEEYDTGRQRRLGQEKMSPYLREIRNHLRILRVTAPEIRRASFSWE